MRRFFGLLTLFGREDFKTYRGTLTPEEHDGRPGQHLTLVHIPETAGSSFLEDSPGFMKRGDVLVGNRGRSWWYTREIQQVAAEAMVVIVRSPVAQTVSQFLKCKYDTWGKRETRKSRFPRRTAGDVFGGLNVWLRHFTSRDGNDTISDNFRCYQPWNMQARYLGAESVTDHHYWYAESVSELRPSFARTKRALDESGFVGIADFYSATMCLFHHHNTGNYRSFTCSCAAALEKQKKSKAKKKEKKKASSLHHIKHEVPRYNISMLSPETFEMVRSLTRIDALVFGYSLRSFKRRVEAARNTTGVDILCGDR